MENKLKVLIIGSPQCGKSCVANYLAGRIDTISSIYRPTVGVRILKCIKNIVHDTAPEGEKMELHFWDLSGDPKFENCWLAAKQDVDGIILVVNADIKFNQEELESFIRNFPKEMEIKPGHCLGLLHHPSGFIKQDSKDTTICGLQFHHSCVEEGKSSIQPFLEKFLTKIANKKMAEIAAAERDDQGNEY